MKAFWAPEIKTSICHSSIGQGMAPIPDIPSTTSKASVLDTISAYRRMSYTVPVDVSERVVNTARAPGELFKAEANLSGG